MVYNTDGDMNVKIVRQWEFTFFRAGRFFNVLDLRVSKVGNTLLGRTR
jgi:hypothetical protein